MQREMTWLKNLKDKKETRNLQKKITSEELEKFLEEEEGLQEISHDEWSKKDQEIEDLFNPKEKSESLENLENSWRVKDLREKENKNKDEKKTGRACVICGGEILQRSFIPFIGNSDVYGPGGRNQATEADRQIDGYHCSICGLKYHFPPPKDLLKAKSKI